MSRFLIWGGGGHGKVVADLVRSLDHELIGYVDADAAKLGCEVEPGGARVVMLQDELLRCAAGEGPLPEGVTAVALAIGSNTTRLHCLAQLTGLSAPALVHPTAVVSPSAVLGAGTVVFPGAVINADARIGAAVIVNSAAVVEHDCVVGDGAHLSPRATLAGGVRVGERSWVGAGATVIQGISIGADVTVGAGAVVIRDVPDGQTVVGVPARSIGRGRRDATLGNPP
jgi:sugar O-acyltransferase (sialic acid O-acetyltransferase NeuD family)